MPHDVQEHESAWDDGLEGPAWRIAANDSSPFRVQAGPGTGKTFALKRRVARLLQSGVNPRRIFVCTFTRTAAKDLQNEIIDLGIPGADEVRAGTLHSFCFGVLNRAAVLELTGRTPRTLLGFEERFLEEDLKRSSDNFGGIRDCREKLAAFNAAWARLQSDAPGWPSDPTDREFERELLSWLEFHGAMLLGEIIPVTLRYLRENPACEELGAFDHILVDEYQDLNRAEQELTDLLAQDSKHLIVGDEDQSIYSFKYAHPEGISTFHDSHPGTHDEELDDCRRCPQLVVRLANRLIANNTERLDRVLNPWPGNPEGEVHVVQWPRLEDEAAGLAQYVSTVIAEGTVGAGEILVLAQRRQFGYAIRDQLNAAGISAHSFFFEEALEGNPCLQEECDPLEAFTLLTLLSDPEDRVALRTWCGLGSTTLRAASWGRLRAYCNESGQAPRDALQLLYEDQLSIPYTKQIVQRYSLLRNLLNDLEGLTGAELVDTLFPEESEWSNAFRSIVDSPQIEDIDPSTLREIIRVGITQPELPTDVDYVRIMSLHKSKGLSAKLVIVSGCIEGILPTIPDNLTANERRYKIEEQRRLFYVGITRTRNILVLSSVLNVPRRLAHRIGARVTGGNRSVARTVASRFLEELGPERPQAVRGDRLLN